MSGRAQTRQAAYMKGVMAEQACALFLRARGYHILEMRYKTRVGEIDILARKGAVLAAVEVKARKDQSAALEAVTPRNRRRVEQALLHYVSEHPEAAQCDLRFDVMSFTGLTRIAHLENAWRPEA